MPVPSGGPNGMDAHKEGASTFLDRAPSERPRGWDPVPGSNVTLNDILNHVLNLILNHTVRDEVAWFPGKLKSNDQGARQPWRSRNVLPPSVEHHLSPVETTVAHRDAAAVEARGDRAAS